MVKAKVTAVKTKKHPGVFKRHQFDRFPKLDGPWRKPKGIDNRVRRKFRGQVKLPKVGYGTKQSEKYVMPNGLLPFVVRNVKELDLLLMQNKKYAAVISHNVSRKSRKAIRERAAQLNIRLTNGTAKVKTAESK